ncbi:unnamed protein product [Adineta steineri]|uniref:G-protein coupled receptors family 1 profile domain-containing protein n=1 Tax=Adineta steineri TaxID=433720 RepID=A0A819HJ61_9BILA|nr:unnamed protein product [Adineta steineri]CAF1417057.1 unnamed protein product [Adineta steineri]CAF1465198.1 unnamed protein product [Adineta steineri]CAF3857975.1 unnamed protein product [Adineta steineri]CAF3899354.1 unnamed protein product [Adineta steineri]
MSTSAALSIIQNEFSRYASLLTIVGGVFGNICILILFSRRWKNSCALCLLCAAIFNGLNIIVNVWSRLYATFGPDMTNLNVDLCKLRYYSGHVWSQIGRYMVCLACIDRYFLVANNIRFRIINRPVVIRSIIGGIIVFWHIVGIHVVILTKIENGFCSQFGVYNLIYFVYTLIVVSFIPPLLMVVFGVRGYRVMKRLHARIQPLGHTAAGNNGDTIVNRRDRELLYMVLVESAVYVSTNVLFPLINLEIGITNYMGRQKSPLYSQIELFLLNLGSVFIYFNNAVPFYTYLMASKTFRKDVKELFTKFWHRLVG